MILDARTKMRLVTYYNVLLRNGSIQIIAISFLVAKRKKNSIHRGYYLCSMFLNGQVKNMITIISIIQF